MTTPPNIVNQIKQLFERYTHVNVVLMDQALVSGINFLTGLMQARYLGIQEFGKFSIAWIIMLFLVNLQTAAILSPMLSIGPKQAEEKRAEYFGSVFMQQVGFACITSFLVFWGIHWSDIPFPQWKISNLALPLACVSFCSQLQEFMRRYFFTNSRPVDAFINDIISYLGQIILVFLLFKYRQADTSQILYIMSSTSLLAVLVAIFRLGPMTFQLRCFMDSINRHLESSRWLVASSFVQWISSNFMIMAASTLWGPLAVGTIKACQNILGITHILFNGLSNLVPVRGSRILHEKGLVSMEKYLLKTLLWGGGLTLLMTLPAILIPGTILKWVYGKDFGGEQWILVLFAFIYLALFFNQLLTYGLRIFENTKPIFLGYLIAAITSLIIGIPLLLVLKLPGVIIGFIPLTLINMLTLWVSYTKIRKQFQTNENAKP